MTPAQFRKAALALEGAKEEQHMNHPDFRRDGRVFATLNEDETRGMVKIPPELQASALEDESGAFTPAAGAWGRAGCTLVALSAAPAPLVKALLKEAWTLAGAKKSASAKRR